MITNSEIMMPLQALHVLVVEDGAVHQRLARGLLRRHGCEVTIVDNGRAALQAAESRQFDLILMDVEMPEMDGVTATKILRRDNRHPNQHTPVVGVSSSGRKSDCLRAGMDDYVAKPLRDDRLIQLLDQIQPRPIRKSPQTRNGVEPRCDANCP